LKGAINLSQKDLPKYHKELAKYFATEKQHLFTRSFFTDAENYEVWDEVDFADMNEVDGENTFTIKAEDLKFYAEGVWITIPAWWMRNLQRSRPMGS
jgi:hypothetical protein